MAPLIVVSVVAVWALISVPAALIVGRISHRADVGSEQRNASLMLAAPADIRGITGTVGTLTR